MIQELVEFGRRVTKGKSMALKEEPFVVDLVINEYGEFMRFIVGDKRTIDTDVISAMKCLDMVREQRKNISCF